jgi:glutamate 5-kinase
VPAITAEITAMASDPRAKDGHNVGSGGMVTKLDAARIAMGGGCHVVVADGRIDHPLVGLGKGAPCTWFVASQSPVQARKQWIAGSLAATGTIRVDEGAVRALLDGRSLLPAGVLEVTGGFERGDAVAVVGPDGTEVARGLVAYDIEDAATIAGRQSSEIETLIGFSGPAALIHRDDLVVTRRDHFTMGRP